MIHLRNLRMNPYYTLPLALYIHLPWCIRKCPYCDFNSHEIKDGSFPEKDYIEAIIRDLKFTAEQFRAREISSIFFGGGTPSVISANGIGMILEAVNAISALSADTEITLEANPGAVDSRRFAAYRRLGVNRLSIGVQSFSDDKLAAIGRIHNGNDALAAFETAVSAGFSNINIDLMYGLPGQTTEDALSDLARAVSLDPTHVSWYQLTIEPNTVFYSKPPTLPDDDLTWQMQTCGQDYLTRHRYRQYEISAWSRENHECLHNTNYWQFGDYIGIGAGAHSKITTRNDAGCLSLQTTVTRQSRLRSPASYIRNAGTASVIADHKTLAKEDCILEFMLNALRLNEGVPQDYFSERTGLSSDAIHEQVESARNDGLLEDGQELIKATGKGARYLNDLLQYFNP